jgi:hypothetical protein
MENVIAIGDKAITLHLFPAFEGFELNRRYRTDYRTQSDSNIRSAFALDVLSHAEFNGERLNGVERVNFVCENWKNLETVFHAILEFNNIDLELAEEKARWFEFAGAELAASFIVEATKLMVPFLKATSEEQTDG